jgi:hypothetical protein
MTRLALTLPAERMVEREAAHDGNPGDGDDFPSASASVSNETQMELRCR